MPRLAAEDSVEAAADVALAGLAPFWSSTSVAGTISRGDAAFADSTVMLSYSRVF